MLTTEERQELAKGHVGESVLFSDSTGRKFTALITNCFSVNDDDEPMTANVVYVSENEGETDQYGRQIKRATSVTRRNEHSAWGYWFDTLEK